MSRVFEVLPYILALGTIILGASEIIKDWNDYQTSKLKVAVASAFIIVAALSLITLYHDKKEAEAAEIKAERDMGSLQAKVDAANRAQADNTKLFLDSFAKMSSQVSDLKADVKNEALQKRLASVQAELQNTEKFLAPGPKAHLSFTFTPFVNPPPPAGVTPIKEMTEPLNSDGTVRIEFVVLNMTPVDATEVGVQIQICDQCSYATEPRNSEHVVGTKESWRRLIIPKLHAMSSWYIERFDIAVPPGARDVPVGFDYRCDTCIVPSGMSPETSGTIHIKRVSQ